MEAQSHASNSKLKLAVAMCRWSVVTLLAAAVTPFAIVGLLFWVSWMFGGIHPDSVRSETVWLATTLDQESWSSLVNTLKTYVVAGALGTMAYRVLVFLIPATAGRIKSRCPGLPRRKISWLDRTAVACLVCAGVTLLTLADFGESAEGTQTVPEPVSGHMPAAQWKTHAAIRHVDGSIQSGPIEWGVTPDGAYTVRFFKNHQQ